MNIKPSERTEIFFKLMSTFNEQKITRLGMDLGGERTYLACWV